MLIALVFLVFNKKEIAGRGAADRGGFIGYDNNGHVMSLKPKPSPIDI